jgi:hypothetical protein
LVPCDDSTSSVVHDLWHTFACSTPDFRDESFLNLAVYLRTRSRNFQPESVIYVHGGRNATRDPINPPLIGSSEAGLSPSPLPIPSPAGSPLACGAFLLWRRKCCCCGILSISPIFPSSSSLPATSSLAHHHPSGTVIPRSTVAPLSTMCLRAPSCLQATWSLPAPSSRRRPGSSSCRCSRPLSPSATASRDFRRRQRARTLIVIPAKAGIHLDLAVALGFSRRWRRCRRISSASAAAESLFLACCEDFHRPYKQASLQGLPASTSMCWRSPGRSFASTNPGSPRSYAPRDGAAGFASVGRGSSTAHPCADEELARIHGRLRLPAFVGTRTSMCSARDPSG